MSRQRLVTAVSFGSQKWAHWRPADGSQILRVSLGRDGLPVAHLDDDALIDAVVRESSCAVAKGVAVRAEGLLAEVVGRPLQRGRNLGAVEPDRAVDSAIADEDDVAVVREPARPFELHVGSAGATLEPKEWLRGVVREGADAGHRQRDQPRDGPRSESRRRGLLDLVPHQATPSSWTYRTRRPPTAGIIRNPRRR